MDRLGPAQRAAIYIAAWLIAVASLGYLGAFEAVPRPFGFAALVTAGILAPTLAAVAITPLARALDRLGLWWLSAFHVWRIPAALLFFWYADQGLLPETFVVRAGWGDLLAGALAFAAMLLATRPAYLTLHLVGFADFLLAVGTGIALLAAHDPLMANIATFPVVLIPLFGVGLSGAGHVVAFRLLGQQRQARTGAAAR